MKKSYIHPIITECVVAAMAICANSKVISPSTGGETIIPGGAPARILYV